MSWLSVLASRIRSLFLKRRLERELDEELRAHIEMATEENLRKGMTPEEARHAARRAFGGVEQTKEVYRERRGLPAIESLLRDIRYAARILQRSPSCAAAILTLSLGLGLNTVLFTVFEAFVLRPLAVRDPYSLYQVICQTKEGMKLGFSWREYSELKEQKALFSDALALAPPMKVTLDKRWTIFGMAVSGNYLSSLGGDTVVGRPILPDDADKPGARSVVVLSYNLWRNCFEGDRSVVGRKVLINGYPFEVNGVMRHSFETVTPIPNGTDLNAVNMGSVIGFWIPLTALEYVRGESDPFSPTQPMPVVVIARLHTGISPGQVESALLPYAQQTTVHVPPESRVTRVQLVQRATRVGLSPGIIALFLPLMAVFGLVLFVSCANVANMMLARAVTRQREIGIRLSLGASRARVTRQLLTEGLLIALLAGLVGIMIARGTIVIGSQAFTAFWQAHAPGRFSQLYREPPMPSFSLDYRVFVFALVLATIVTIAFALAPALRSTKPSVCGALRGEISGIRLSTLHGWLLAGQVAVCALFLIFSGVLLRDVIRASSIDPGFQVRGVFEVECSKHQAIEIAEKLNALPWAEQVAIANRVPLDLRLRVAASRPDKGDETRILANIVSPAYFATFGIPVVHGRNFTREEALTQQPVVILSETTAKKLWPNEDPLGKTIRTRIPHPPFQDAEVIGIVKDVANEGVLYPDRDCLYFPTEIGVSDGGALVIRSKAAPGTTALMLERVLEKISTSDEEQEPWYAPMQFVWDWQMLPMRAASWISALLGALALLLTVSGIYGVVAYLVSQRTQEIGIRMALGATRARVVGYILAKSMKLVSAGIGVGVLLALVASRLLSTKIGATIGEIDLMAYFTGPAIITIAAALAVLGPIRRASKVDPAVTLRAE